MPLLDVDELTVTFGGRDRGRGRGRGRKPVTAAGPAGPAGPVKAAEPAEAVKPVKPVKPDGTAEDKSVKPAEPAGAAEGKSVRAPGDNTVMAVNGVSFSVDEGQIVGLVGESGCGKSVTSLALMGLLPRKGVALGGRADFEGTDLLAMSPGKIRDLRGSKLAMIFQDPLSSLNPVVPIGVQVTEILKRHRGMKGEAARKEAVHLLDRVGIPDPDRRLREYPHQLSGGMRQRALIAMAVACAPRLLIADEPTTALDVTIQAQILELLKELVDQEGTALLMITHDLGVVAGLCDQVNVLYAGKVVESSGRRELFAHPTHPYTHGLLGSIPRLDAPRGEPLNPVRGSINDQIAWADGCAFAPRCDRYEMGCLTGTPELTEPREAGHQARCVNPVPATTEVPA